MTKDLITVFKILCFFVAVVGTVECGDASNADIGSDSDSESASTTDLDTDSDTGADTDSSSVSDTDGDGGADADADTDTATDTNLDTDSDTGADTDTGTVPDTDSSSNTDTDIDTDADIDASVDAGTDTDSETATDDNCYDGVYFDEAKIDLSDVEKEFPLDEDTDHTIGTPCPPGMSVTSSPCLFYEAQASYYTGCCDGNVGVYIGVQGENRIQRFSCHIGCSPLGQVTIGGLTHYAHRCFN